MKCPQVSIIMGTFNPDLAELKKAVQSILDQTLSSWELLICDDGSMPEIYSQVKQLEQSDERIRCLKSDQNEGLASALNKCIDQAKGIYIARMDDDDLSLPERLQREVDFLETHPEYAWVGCEADLFDDNGVWGRASRLEDPVKTTFLHSSPFIHPSVVFRRTVFDNQVRYSTEKTASRCEDYELFMRLYSKGLRGHNLQEVLFQYRDERAVLKRSMKYCYFEMLVRIRGFKKLGILSVKNMIYVVKPIAVGILAQMPKVAQAIRTNRVEGDHVV